MSNLKKVNLATAVNITTSYSGEFAGSYIAAALLSASTINDGGLTVKSNISYKEVIKKLATGSLVSPASCDFDPNSSVTLTERIIEPVELQVNLQLCKKDFVNDWEIANQMGFGLSPGNFLQNSSDFLIAHVAAEVAQSTELNIWKGDTAAASNNSFDGFEKTNCCFCCCRRYSSRTTSCCNWWRIDCCKCYRRITKSSISYSQYTYMVKMD